jgi:hypothetical protein
VSSISASVPSSGVSAPDAGETRTYRQYLRAGRRPIQLVLVLEIAWLMVGAVVLRQLTGPGPDRLARTLVGLVIWIGPLVVIGLPLILGPRWMFRDWWWPRLVVRVDDEGLAWWTEESVRPSEDAIAWSAVASVYPTLPTRNRPPGADCALAAPDGQVLARLPCRLVRIDRPASPRNRWRRVAWLPDVAVAVRPDRYRRRRVLGRRATLRDPASDPMA